MVSDCFGDFHGLRRLTLAAIIVQISTATGEFVTREFGNQTTVHFGQNQTENSIRLTGPNIAPTHLVLERQVGVWRVVALTPLGTPTLNGFFLPPNSPQEVQDGAIIRVGSNELRFFYPIPPTLPETDEFHLAAPTPQYVWQLGPTLAAVPQVPYIIATLDGLPSNGLSVIPGETVRFTVQIINQGPQQAVFKLEIPNISQKWWSCQSAELSLFPGNPGQMTVSITPPRLPESSAGDYELQLQVWSPHYPGHSALCQTGLTILPYYEFIVYKPLPWRRIVGWHVDQARFTASLENKSNVPLQVRLIGQDDDEACQFSFEPDGQALHANGDYSATIAPGQTQKMRAMVNLPRDFPIFFRRRAIPFIVTVTPQGMGLEPSRLTGKLEQNPLIGLLSFVLLTLLLLLLCAPFVLWPHILSFQVDKSVAPLPKQEGQPVTVEWWASPLVATLRLEPGVGLITNEPIGARQITVDETTTFELQAENLFSRLVSAYLFPGLEPHITRQVLVTPVPPSIAQLSVNPGQIIPGEEVKLAVDIRDAQAATLYINGTPEPLPTDAFHSERPLTPQQDTHVIAMASKRDMVATQVITIVVVTPTSTPTAPPQVGSFSFSDTQISAGETIELTYDVKGGGQVILEPLGPLPPNGKISLTPQESTVYTLISVDEAGQPTVLAKQEVNVASPTSTPTATPVPAAPTIVEFKSSKTQVALNEFDNDDDRTATLFWTVEGTATDIQLLNKQGVAIQTNLDRVGKMDVLVGENDNQFILIAYNGPISSRKTVFIKTIIKPKILFFKATIDPSVNDVFRDGQKTCSTSPSNEDDRRKCVLQSYNISGSTPLTFTLSWKVEGATQVKLETSSSETDQALEDELSVSTTEEKIWYNLVVKSDMGQDRRKLIICDQSNAGDCQR